MSSNRHWEQDKESTLYIGNLAEQTTDAQVWELMLQAGPVANVHLPKDRVTQTHQGYGFVEFASEEDADYACKIMNQIRLWGKPIRVNKASADKRVGGVGGDGQQAGGATQGVGAELFVGNLDGMVDEKTLFDTFSRFGPLVAPPKVTRDDSGLSKGYGFVSYASFEAADDAIANMHGQFLSNKEITVQFAFKKDGKGERHGDEAERRLARQAIANNVEVHIPAMPSALVMPSNAPTGPSNMNGGYRPPLPPQQFPPQPSPYGGGYNAYAPPPQQQYQPPQPPQQYGYAPSPQNHNGGGYAPPPRQYAQSPLQAPTAAGLPPRPPQSLAGYGGPPPQQQSNGFGGPPPGGLPMMGGPPGFGGPPGMPMGGPPGFGGPPMGGPPGFGGPPGMPPGYPPQGGGYQQQR